ncbi:hypothetical protein ACND5I_000317, partial [Escherichia coli]
SAFMIFNQMNEVRNDLFKEFISDLNASFINHPYSIETSDGDLSKRGANFYIPLSPDGNYSLCWEFEYSGYYGLFFGISGVSLVEGQSAKIAAAMSEIFPHTQGKSSEYWSWWSRGLDLQGKNRIPRDWGNDGAVWAKLRERDADSIFAATREAILAVHEKLDMDLLR